MKVLSAFEKLDLILKEVADNSNPDITQRDIFGNLTSNSNNSANLDGYIGVGIVVDNLFRGGYISRIRIEKNRVLSFYDFEMIKYLILDSRFYWIPYNNKPGKKQNHCDCVFYI